MNARVHPPIPVVVVDFGMGNLFSVARACEHAGLRPTITDEPTPIRHAAAVVLPGVGGFADAMRALEARGLIDVLIDEAGRGKPLLGVCLGMQLLLETSSEFGEHRGLGLIAGQVERIPRGPGPDGSSVKVPHVGWNRISVPRGGGNWDGTLLAGMGEGTYVYFVHSYFAAPTDPRVVVAETGYGPLTYCSALRRDNIHGVQFHPERSGPHGLVVYDNFAKMLRSKGESRT